MHIYSSQVPKKEGRSITLKGWVSSRRDHGKLIFIDLRDKEGLTQIVLVPGDDKLLKTANMLRPEWVVRVQGLVNKRPLKMRNTEEAQGDIELEILELKVLSEAQELPFEKEADVNLDILLDYRPLTLRNHLALAAHIRSRCLLGACFVFALWLRWRSW